jgi:hypothetical protein
VHELRRAQSSNIFVRYQFGTEFFELLFCCIRLFEFA